MEAEEITRLQKATKSELRIYTAELLYTDGKYVDGRLRERNQIQFLVLHCVKYVYLLTETNNTGCMNCR